MAELNKTNSPTAKNPNGLRELIRSNSEKLGDAAEIFVLPKNKRSLRRRHTADNDPETASVESNMDPNKRYCPWLFTLIVLFQVGVLLLSKSFTWLTLCYDPFRRHEVWRFVSVAFSHPDPVYLAILAVFEIILGATLEATHGWLRTGPIFVSGVIMGSLFRTIFLPKSYAVGAGGGIYGLLAAHIATLVFNWKQMEWKFFRILLLTVFILLDVVLPAVLITNYDIYYSGTFGGAVGGFVVALFLLKNFEVLPWESKFKKIVGGIGVAIFVVIVVVNVAYPSHYYPTEYSTDYVQTWVNYVIGKIRQVCLSDEECKARLLANATTTVSTIS